MTEPTLHDPVIQEISEIPTPAPTPVHLALKLCAIMEQVERLPKNGYNDFHKYHYVMEADVTDTLRRLMAEQHLVMFPAIDTVEHQGDLTTVHMRFTLVDADSGESLVIPWVGQGQDKNDKGISKAITAATKYVLLKTFQLSAGDDPEADTRASRAAALSAKAKRAGTAPAARPTLPVEPFLVRITQGSLEPKTSRDGESLLFFRGQAAVVETGETFPLAAWRTNAQVLEAHRKQQQPVLLQGGFQDHYPDFQVKSAAAPKPQAVPNPPPSSALASAAPPPAGGEAPAVPPTEPTPPKAAKPEKAEKAEHPKPAAKGPEAASAASSELPAALRKELWAHMKQAKLSPPELIAFANEHLGTTITHVAQLTAEQIQTLMTHLDARAS